MTNQRSAKFALWCSRLIGLVLLVLCVVWYRLVMWYQGYRPLGLQAAAAVFWGFYLCVPAVLYALWCIDRLLKNILADDIFIMPNVCYIRRIRWCCAGVSLICLVAGFWYQPLLFLAVILAFLSLVVSVVKNVMAAAVEIREENDLTV